ncbi:hypothetical protein FXF52_34840 [Micromonospora sp. MP36]|nr:hypothetical protein FXF52_34840 [Micromonospora sp. MP36]
MGRICRSHADRRGPHPAGRRPRCSDHPRTAWRRRFAVTMEIYTQVSSKATREALKCLGDVLDG